MKNNNNVLPLIPLRGLVVFPYTNISIDIGRDSSKMAIELAERAHNLELIVVAQKDERVDNPQPADIYEIGTRIRIKQFIKLPKGIIRLQAEAKERVLVKKYQSTEPFHVAEFVECAYHDGYLVSQAEAHKRTVLRLFEQLLQSYKFNPEDIWNYAININSMRELAYYVASIIELSIPEKQAVLETNDLPETYDVLEMILRREIEIEKIENKIDMKVNKALETHQKEFVLREKIKAIYDELGETEEPDSEAKEFLNKLEQLNLEENIEKRIKKEISRYKRMPSMSPESGVLRNYIECVLDLPWNSESDDNVDLKIAKAVLDKDHYGLKEVKERILEFLAVRKLTDEHSGSILCLVGPPGVGKTSLATSIAKALNKKFVRASLGGVHDEAEIRGHRRTYLGSMPGRLIQGLKNAGTKNPVFLLDEIDKLGHDYKGDPAAALLEVLDPEQNNTFSDHYVELPFDFSKVFWITTANYYSDIPAPLLDRMEIINLSSYSEEEKLEIAKRYLIPKQLKKNGLTQNIKLSDAVIKKIISEYTMEAGVRTLEKTIGKVFRKLAYRMVTEDDSMAKVTIKNLDVFLGAPKYLPDAKEKRDEVGVVCGLAWTSVGGTILSCEANVMKGSGKQILTGCLGNVMKESGQAALTYIRHNSDKLNLEEDFYNNTDIHIHFPEGATPKDGPSAGITMTLAMISALTNKKVRKDVAMTGEITIRGVVLPIGGLKEKLLAALRHGIKEVLIPFANKKDLAEMPDSVKDNLKITLVKTMDDVLERALVK